MTKAGIVTFHCVPNYGAALQAYALFQNLKKYYDDVKVIDYCPDCLLSDYKTFDFSGPKAIIGSALTAPACVRKKRKFKRFVSERMDLEPWPAADKALHSYDSVFCGSDQIWNSEITKGIDPMYFADCFPGTVVKASYAASIGKSALSDADCKAMLSLVSRLNRISVREPEAADLIEKLTGNRPEVVVDPTILAGKDLFAPIVRPLRDRPYVLYYQLARKDSRALSLAEKIARYKNLDLVGLCGNRAPQIGKRHDVICDAGPEEFVSLIAGADYVVTDSFHGTVFSLLFHRPFASIPKATRGGRITNLLDIVGLMVRYTDRFDKDVLLRDIDWGEVDNSLAREREVSEHFVTSIRGDF